MPNASMKAAIRKSLRRRHVTTVKQSARHANALPASTRSVNGSNQPLVAIWLAYPPPTQSAKMTQQMARWRALRARVSSAEKLRHHVVAERLARSEKVTSPASAAPLPTTAYL